MPEIGLELRDNLSPSPLEYLQQRVLTTLQLAEGYGTATVTIRKNFKNNKSRYAEGEHYFFLQGKEMSVFKNSVQNLYSVDNRTPYLYLWTEKGAFLHAKSLNTDRAWQVYEHLIDSYFKHKATSLADTGLSPDMRLIKQLFANIMALETRLQMMEQSQARQDSAESPRLDRLIELLEIQQRSAQTLKAHPQTILPDEPLDRAKLRHNKLLTKKEVAIYIGVGITTVDNLKRRPDFPPVIRIGSRVFIDRAKLDAWIDAQSVR